MKKVTHPIYKNHPEQPYISPDRDIKAWGKAPEAFPYGIIEKKQMIRLPEGILPGDIIMLWRIHFNNFTNTTVIPQYFEYKYGVDSDECIQTLIRLGYVEICSARDSLDALTMNVLKDILEANNLDKKGKKSVLLNRIVDTISESKLTKLFSLRKYKITPSGELLLKKYNTIIQKHGPKM